MRRVVSAASCPELDQAAYNIVRGHVITNIGWSLGMTQGVWVLNIHGESLCFWEACAYKNEERGDLSVLPCVPNIGERYRERRGRGAARGTYACER